MLHRVKIFAEEAGESKVWTQRAKITARGKNLDACGCWSFMFVSKLFMNLLFLSDRSLYEFGLVCLADFGWIS